MCSTFVLTAININKISSRRQSRRHLRRAHQVNPRHTYIKVRCRKDHHRVGLQDLTGISDYDYARQRDRPNEQIKVPKPGPERPQEHFLINGYTSSEYQARCHPLRLIHWSLHLQSLHSAGVVHTHRIGVTTAFSTSQTRPWRVDLRL